MTKLLKVLLVFLLLLSIAALVLGTMLFKKREILLGRTHKLETAITALATTIEAEAVEIEDAPDFPEKDVSPVTSEVVDDPERSEIWEEYDYALEVQEGRPLFDLSDREQALRSYFKIDPVTGDYVRDGQGRRVTTGEGTMQNVLNDVLAKSEGQLNRLNATRQQLRDLRKEFVDTIEEHNRLKSDQRRTLITVEEKDEQIAQLQSEIEPLKQEIATMREEKRSLEDTIAEQQRDYARLQEDNADKDAEVDLLKEQVQKLETMLSDTSGQQEQQQTTLGTGTKTFTGKVEPGMKGQVVAVNPEWNFAVISLSDQFMAELLSDEEAGVPQVELMLKRPGEEEEFVTKIRLMQVKREEQLGICDILPDWKQSPVQKGDVVFY